jgi:hypothetical protein
MRSHEREGGIVGHCKSSLQMGVCIVHLGVWLGHWLTCRWSSRWRMPYEVRGQHIGQWIEWHALCGGACSLEVCRPVAWLAACS